MQPIAEARELHPLLKRLADRYVASGCAKLPFICDRWKTHVDVAAPKDIIPDIGSSQEPLPVLDTKLLDEAVAEALARRPQRRPSRIKSPTNRFQISLRQQLLDDAGRPERLIRVDLAPSAMDIKIRKADENVIRSFVNLLNTPDTLYLFPVFFIAQVRRLHSLSPNLTELGCSAVHPKGRCCKLRPRSRASFLSLWSTRKPRAMSCRPTTRSTSSCSCSCLAMRCIMQSALT